MPLVPPAAPAFMPPAAPGLGLYPTPSLGAFQPPLSVPPMAYPPLNPRMVNPGVHRSLGSGLHSSSSGDLGMAARMNPIPPPPAASPSFLDPALVQALNNGLLPHLLMQQQQQLQAIAALAAVNASGLQQLPPYAAAAALQAQRQPRPWSAGIPDPSNMQRLLAEQMHLQALLAPLPSISSPLDAGSLPLPTATSSIGQVHHLGGPSLTGPLPSWDGVGPARLL